MDKQYFYCERCDLIFWWFQWQINNHKADHNKDDEEEEEQEAERKREREAVKAKKASKKARQEARIKKAAADNKAKTKKQSNGKK